MQLKIISSLVFFASILTVTTPGYSADMLPLAAGNSWTYQDAVSGHSFTVRVGTPVSMGGGVYHTLRGYTSEPLLVRVNQYGNIVYWDEEIGQDILLISFEAVPRAWWEAPKRQCSQQGQTSGARSVHTGPAGNWDALDIVYRSLECADAGDQSEQFAENIGMIRRVMNTIAGPRTYDLVYARIGNQVVSSGQVGGFTVTAAPSRSAGFWTVTLGLDLPAGTSLKLSFPSSQQYDARLRDSEGTILWTWSADKLFAQVYTQFLLSGRLTASIEVPQPPATPETPHFYTIEAWLTNSPDEPRFAAATGVQLIPAMER